LPAGTVWQPVPPKLGGNPVRASVSLEMPGGNEYFNRVLTGAACCGTQSLGLGLVEYIIPDFSTAPRKIKKSRNSAQFHIVPPFTPGEGVIKCLILYSLISPRVALCRNMSEYVGIFLLKIPTQRTIAVELSAYEILDDNYPRSPGKSVF